MIIFINSDLKRILLSIIFEDYYNLNRKYMSGTKLQLQLEKLNSSLGGWTQILAGYKQWAKENDGVISEEEHQTMERIRKDILAIFIRIIEIGTEKGFYKASPEDKIVLAYNTKLIAFTKYFSDVTCKNRDAVVVVQSDVDKAEEGVDMVKAFHDFHKKNEAKITPPYKKIITIHPIEYYEERLTTVKAWLAEPEERYNDSELLKDYKEKKKEGPQPLVPPKQELLPETYFDPELEDDDAANARYKEYGDLPLYDEIDGIKSTDAIQGDDLGDCYAISALSAIASANPELIKQNIKVLENGLFEVTVYVREVENGVATERKKKTVVVDADFPSKVIDGVNVPIYAHSDDAEIWPMIMEKAYAKAMGGYDNIEGGTGEEALAVFTGSAPRNFIVSRSEGKLQFEEAGIINAHTKATFLAILKTAKMALLDSSSSIKSAAGFDLIGNHSYALSEYKGTTIKLRNPHGENHFEFEEKEDAVWLAMSKVAIL
jgi:hypothetical protein